MSVVAGLDALVAASDTFSDWLNRTNAIAEYMRDHVMTASANTAEQDTNGDARLIGDFQANTLIAYDDLRGGTLLASANLIVSSNAVFQANVDIQSPGELFIRGGKLTADNTLFHGITFSTTSASDIIDQWAYADSKGFKYLVHATDGDGDSYIVEFLAVHDANNVAFTRYAELGTGGIAVDITPSISGANVIITAVSGANATNTYVFKLLKTAFV